MSISITNSSRLAAVAVGAGLVLAVAFGGFAAPAHAALSSAQVQSILSLLQSFGADSATIANVNAALTGQGGGSTGGSTGGSSSVSCTFTRDMTIGSSGADVTCLQQALISMGFSIPAGATGYFGVQTQTAVASWQASKNVAPAAGYFGAISRGAWVNTSGGGSTGGGSTGGGALEGGAGDINDADLVSALSNEEAGEGDEDVEVAGIEIEAEGSDIELRAVTIDFDQLGSGNDDLDEYADEVSVWFDGEEVARVDAEDFEDDDNYSETISLDGGAIIREGETGELTVAISVLENLDNDQEGDEWNVGFNSVRFMDAQDATVTDSSTGDLGESGTANDTTTDSDERQFSLESFATAADVELKVSEGDDDINDARTIAVDDSDNTDDVEVLSFEIEAEGDSDLIVDDLSVDFTSVGAGVGEIINNASIEIDGDVLDSETVSSTTATTRTITFSDIELEIGAGDTVTVTVIVDVNDFDGGFEAGNTLVTDVNPDDAAWDVEDEEGETVGSTDKTGSASSEAHSFFADGLNIATNADDAEVDDSTPDAAGGEEGSYTITVELTAFGDTLYIPFGTTDATSSVDTDDGFAYAIENSDGLQIDLNGAGLASTTAVVSSTADTSGNFYVIDEGETEEFTVTITLTPAADGFFRAQFYGVNFNVGDASAADTLQQALPAADFETTFIDIDA